MLTLYSLRSGCLAPREVVCPVEAADPEADWSDIVWIDMLRPTQEEEDLVEAKLRLDIPTRDEMKDIEASSRLYEEKGVLYMTAVLVANALEEDPQAEPVTFVLSDRHLVTVRYTEPKAFPLYVASCVRQPVRGQDARLVLLGLLQAIVERAAEVLERVGADLDLLSRRVFRRNAHRRKDRPRADLQLVVERLGANHDLTFKVRETLLSLQRLVGFLGQHLEGGAYVMPLGTLRHDLASLSEHDEVLSAKVDFMLDATMGLINIEQNGIIKIFSVVSVIFMPPTLVASIYGMNFEWMPELQWPWGYPMALCMMLAAAILPYLYFKFRKWL
ncbi:MAG TPA: magnesium transporter CorA family protein [Azospirillaceae bacterium]|nr:magnesium transporter CorA family protein [Azospirillaceae bacterium]